MNNEFVNFNLSPEILKGVEEAGFKKPSPVQRDAIPLVLEGADIVAQAHTGTGKTAAFGLPIMSMMEHGKNVEVLVVAPTRELAMQVSDELFKLGRYAGVKTVTVYGGQSYSRQIGQIEKGASVLVATPGRLIDLLESKKISISPKFVVLDEADEMLDMGFLDDIKKILSFVPNDSQKLLFSATMPPPIRKITNEFLKDPKFIQITERETTNSDISQEYYVVDEREREDAAIRLMDYYDPFKAIIFCRMKREADELSNTLLAKGYPAKALHGDMDQRERESAIRGFKKGAVEILVATDVAARGLDIADVSHVFNYHIPFDPESYVHRIGRTGRAGKKGTAITLVTPMEFRELQRIKKIVGTSIEHKFIPSRQDLKDDLNQKLLTQVENQKIYDKAPELVQALEEEMELSQIAFKLMSMIMDGQKVTGPEKIGLDANNIQRILEKFKRDRNDRNNRRGGRGGYKGNRGGSSRGGSRGGNGGGGSRGGSGGSGSRGRDRDRNRSRSRDS